MRTAPGTGARPGRDTSSSRPRPGVSSAVVTGEASRWSFDIVTLADPHNPNSPISLMTYDETAPVVPEVSIQVDDVDAAYAAALQAGCEIVHPITDEPWGVRHFFVRDPDGHVLNVLSHD